MTTGIASNTSGSCTMTPAMIRYAFIKTVAEILGELAEDVAIDLRTGFGRVDGKMNVVGS